MTTFPDGPSLAAPTRPLYYVLSAGRTGTMFLETLIRRHCPDVHVEHEPSPSRSLMILGNIRNDCGLFGAMTRRLSRSHQETFHGRDGQCIEVNPFLCAVTDLLPLSTRPLRIVHVIREPGAWAQSMTTFKASSRYRHVIDYVPFSKPFPAPRPDGWPKLTPFEKSLHQWIWCNNRIAALAGEAEEYVQVRSEDIFSSDRTVRNATLTRIFRVLDLPIQAETLATDEFSQRVNPAPAGTNLRDAAVERAICGHAATEFGYDI